MDVRKATMTQYAVNPILKQALDAQANFAKNGWVSYGGSTIVHRFGWVTPVGERTSAVVSDCMDDYNAGSMEAKTGKKLTAGLHRDNTRLTFNLQTDGSWKISQIQFLVNIPC